MCEENHVKNIMYLYLICVIVIVLIFGYGYLLRDTLINRYLSIKVGKVLFRFKMSTVYFCTS